MESDIRYKKMKYCKKVFCGTALLYRGAETKSHLTTFIKKGTGISEFRTKIKLLRKEFYLRSFISSVN